MPHSSNLDRTSELISLYARLLQDYGERGVELALDKDDKEWPGDQASVSHYFHVGGDALRLIVAALIQNMRPPPQRILDFPSGSGRVTRHLRAFFPEAEIWACDLYDGHIDFCARQFGARPKKSVEDLQRLKFETDFELVFCGSLLTHLFCGSLLTHLPEEGASAALDAIGRALSPAGLALVTFQGRHAEYIQNHKWKYIEDDLFAVAERQVRTSGFGFADYRGGFIRSHFRSQTHYGIALVRPSWVVNQLEGNPDIRIMSYAERAWDDHQDVLVFGRPGIDAD